MNKKIVIIDRERANHAIALIKSLPYNPHYEIVIREYKRNRSIEQNTLYWKWLTIIANHIGETKEAVHEQFKGAYLVNIFERDNTEYAESIQSLRELWKKGFQKESEQLRNQIVALTSTTDCNTKQMTEYLNAVEQEAHSMGVHLPAPEFHD